jgi:hypothetical protein
VFSSWPVQTGIFRFTTWIKLEEAPETTPSFESSPAFDSALRLRIKQLETDLAKAREQLDAQAHELARLRASLS